MNIGYSWSFHTGIILNNDVKLVIYLFFLLTAYHIIMNNVHIFNLSDYSYLTYSEKPIADTALILPKQIKPYLWIFELNHPEFTFRSRLISIA